MEKLTGIIQACKRYKTTSRTLRYYEERGLIKSVRQNGGGLRLYERAELEKLEKILFLRALGLSLEDVKAVVGAGENTNAVLKAKSAQLCAELERLKKKLRLIEEALSVAQADGDIYSINAEAPFEHCKSSFIETADACTALFLRGRFEEIRGYFSDDLKVYLPLEALEKAWLETVGVCGGFLKLGKKEIEDNTVTQYLFFEKIGVTIRYVFNNLQLTGLWLNYFSKDEG